MVSRIPGALCASIALFSLFTGIAVAADPMDAELVAIEKSLWQAWADADPAAFEKHLADETVNMTPGGVTIGKADMLKEIADAGCKVNGFSFGEFTVLRPAQNVALLLYSAEQDAVCDGQALPARVNATSVYVKDGNTWKAAAYTEAPAAE
jgi:hypothetical protein